MAWLGRGNEEKGNENKDSKEREKETEEMVTVEREREFKYTEHEAIAYFESGREREFTFDVMNHNGGDIILKDFTNFTLWYGGMSVPEIQPQTEAFATIPRENLELFETVERNKQTVTKTYKTKVPKSEVED